MPDYIVKDNLTIYNDLIVTGQIYIVENEAALSQVENIEKYTEISGNHENLEVNGDLVVCEYACEIKVNGELRSLGNMVYK